MHRSIQTNAFAPTKSAMPLLIHRMTEISGSTRKPTRFQGCISSERLRAIPFAVRNCSRLTGVCQKALP